MQGDAAAPAATSTVLGDIAVLGAGAVQGDIAVLWDIDGTLIRSNGVGSLAFERAVAHVVGSPPATRVAMAGKTDPQIAREWLEALEVGAEAIESLVAEVLERLEHELSAARHEMSARGHVLPGVVQLLERFRADPTIVQTVLTGNIRPNARVKLEVFNLDRLVDLDVGAYGSDDADRTRLVPVALARLRRLRGAVVEPDRTWVVGDTPRDLLCARAAGARSLLVATGGYVEDDLAGLGADAVLADLSDVEAVSVLIKS